MVPGTIRTEEESQIGLTADITAIAAIGIAAFRNDGAFAKFAPIAGLRFLSLRSAASQLSDGHRSTDQ